MLKSIMILKIKNRRCHPFYGHPGDAGMDLYAAENVTIRARVCDTDRVLQWNSEGYAGLVWDRSGLAMVCLKTLGGVVDSVYRGEIMIGIINLGGADYVVEKGHKVAQMLIQKIESPVLEEVEAH